MHTKKERPRAIMAPGAVGMDLLAVTLFPYMREALARSGRVRGTFPQHNKAPTGGSSCRGLCCRILPELTGKLQFLLRREQFIERVAFRLVYKVALWRSIFAVEAIEIA